MTERPELMIGLETHVQITALKTKLFCGCNADYRENEPNTNVCPVCIGLPGSLPVLNEKVLDLATTLALALGCEINKRQFFFRKNYFYPDMSCNFQISQYDKAGGVPFGSGGSLTFKSGGESHTVTLSRIHLENDPGKLVHQGSIVTSPYTLVDYNRCGIALVEIVTNPDLTSPEEARDYLKALRSIIEHCGVADLSLDGATRTDANISMMINGKEGGRVEVKNINSFKDVEKALKFEMIRQKQALKAGGDVPRETRHWTGKNTTVLRTKESEEDYRYFPEPDLVPVEISDDSISNVRHSMPELPHARVIRFQEQFGLSEYDADVLVSEKDTADFFEQTCQLYYDYKQVTNWLMGDITRRLNERDVTIKATQLTPLTFADMISAIEANTITGKVAKDFIISLLDGESLEDLIDGLQQKGGIVSDKDDLEALVDDVLADNPKLVE
ncbi:MAG TPA: Asp-tRNA(Asn)/Glu-tRNA(Gln) amidotransferase subunit GatB, partial [Candidatus Lokiarchaeia archaeon]|nr:Asp-tRNA(Asn)/Glu-tRNA(Gln) amidotransferase subunit GatB [Candidatus Lokiarchaeia archaeon]